MRRVARLVLQVGISITVFLWIIRMADTGKVVASIASFNPVYLVLSALFFIAASLFIAISLYVVLKEIDDRITFRHVVESSFAGQLLSDVTPSRSGYFVTPVILKRIAGVDIDKGMAGVIATGIANSLVKITLALIGLFYFRDMIIFSSKPLVKPVIMGVTLMALGGLLLTASLSLYTPTRYLVYLSRKVPYASLIINKVGKLLERVQSWRAQVTASMPLMIAAVLASVILNSTAIAFIYKGLQGSFPNLIDIILIVGIVSTLMYIPVSFAGLGVQEAGYALLLSEMGMELDKAIALALIVRALFTGTDVVGLPVLVKIGYTRGEGGDVEAYYSP